MLCFYKNVGSTYILVVFSLYAMFHAEVDLSVWTHTTCRDRKYRDITITVLGEQAKNVCV